MTLKGGRVVWDWNPRSAVDCRTLSNDYGIRPADKIIRPPK
jgi:hypothetical protein